MELLLSVIVPCYNSEKYIERCIRSIQDQTYQTLEIIVIDDGSCDNSAEIIKNLAAEDNRIKYYYQENAGVSAARNKGLKEAKGKYITFVDSDDTVLCDMYKTLIDLLISNNADISHCSYQRVSSKNEIKRIGGNGKISIMNNKDGLCSLLKGNVFSCGIWNKVFVSELIQDIKFDEKIKINEDYLFAFYAFVKASKTVYIDECYYEYHNEEVSSCINTHIIKKAEDQYMVSKIIDDSVFDLDLKSFSRMNLIKKELFLYRIYKLFGDDSQKNMSKELKNKIVFRLKNKEICGMAKKEAMIIRWIPFLYRPIYFIYDKIRTPNWDL